MKGFEKTIGNTHPITLGAVMNIATVYHGGLKDYVKAGELYERALEGREAQLGKHQESTMACALNYKMSLEESGNNEKLEELLIAYPHLKN